METKNMFSDEMEKRSSDELKNLINKEDRVAGFRLAAIWELEKREELSDSIKLLKEKFIASRERVIAQRLIGKRYKTFLRRFIAAIIDGFALYPVLLIINYILHTDVFLIIVIGSIIHNLFPFLYSVFLHAEYGQTLGKMLTNVKVIDVDEEHDITFKKALLRDIVPIMLLTVFYIYSYIFIDPQNVNILNFNQLLPVFLVGMLSPLWTILEILTMLMNDKSRAIHDLIAGTVVVRTD